MNAHAHRRPVAARALSLPCCPAEAIGHRIGVVEARISTLSDPPLPEGIDRHAADAELEQLFALRDCLDADLEWAEPQSLAGVYVILAQLGVISDAIQDGDHNLRPRFMRLHYLAADGLARIADLGVLKEALSAKLCTQTPYLAALRLDSHRA